MFSFRQLFRYKPVEEPGKRGGFLERLLTVVTSALQVIITMVPVVMMKKIPKTDLKSNLKKGL